MTDTPPKNVLRFEHPDHKRQVIRTENLDDATLAAIMGAGPGERSKAAGRRMPPPPVRDNDD